MVQITKYPILSHLRAEPSQFVIRFRSGNVASTGRGLTCWFRPLNSAITVLPGEDLEVPFLFDGRTKDFQEANVQGAIRYRVTDFDRLSQRVDFSVDLTTGLHRSKPLERLSGIVTELAQQFTIDLLASTPLSGVLAIGCEQIRNRIEKGFASDAALADLGIAVVSVRVSSVTPSPEVDKSLRIPVREAIQQEADEATFKRRALAVEKERAIQENELQNKIELSKREELLIQQSGTNERRRVQDEAEAARIVTEGQAARHELEAKAQAAGIQMIEEAKVIGERERMQIYREFPPERLMALAAQDLASKLNTIGPITITPDHMGSILKQLGIGLPASTKRE